MAARINSPFTRFAKKTSTYTGRPATFIIAVLVIVLWACTGPLFDYSDTWQLVINTTNLGTKLRKQRPQPQ